MIPTYFDTTNSQERFMNLRAFFVANSKPSVLVQPRNSAFNNPTIYSQAAAVFGPTFCQNRLDALLTKCLTMRFRIVTPVPKNTVGFATRTTSFACYRRNTINQRQQLCNIMPISSGQFYCQRNPISVSSQMMFRAFFAAIRGVWAGFCPPKTARTEEESIIAREKSIWSAWRSLFNKVRC